MLKCNNYVFAESLEQAYELNQKRTNTIVAGNAWLKLGTKQWATAIDLSRLGLDEIKETADSFVIGAMVTLRDIETNEALNSYSMGALRDALRHIVGTQFRNSATVGGSIYGRFGFSDVLTVFLALNTYVELYKGGIVPLEDFVNMPYDNDILVNIIVKKTPLSVAYESFRLQSTDFPVLTCAISVGEKVRTAIGARPHKATLLGDDENILSAINSDTINAYGEWVSSQYNFGSNMRGSSEYRRHLAKVLVTRALETIS